ncbi:MAG: type IV secretory system conjugative DNA transfer family protein [Acaryochloris sp. RU_4_1]|nr:type IV secretory system conjugative DNA transfer family protein [Acaryochloris sp. RU_4_1]
MQQTIQPQPPPRRELGAGDFIPIVVPAVLLFIIFIFFYRSPRTKIHEQMADARFATSREIRKGNIEAKRQIAKRKLTETGFELNPETNIKFAFSNPGGEIIGLSGLGKSVEVILPLIRSAIEQEHTIYVTDIEGELISKTAAYAHTNGYEIYVYAPGIEELNALGEWAQYTGTFNFLEVMRHADDKAKSQEITRGLNVNTQEDTEKRHAYFGPQSDALLETALMLAKGSQYPDMLMVWAIITLSDLAERLDAAAKSGRFGAELSYFAKQSSAGLRAVATEGKGKGDSPSASIQSSAFNAFSKFIDPGVAKALLPSTIPLEHKGKSIVYCRLDRTQLKATSPLVATALHLWLNYNLDPQRKRDRNLTFISDEANFFILPDLEPLAKLARKKGGTFWLAYQQISGMEEAYGKKRWTGIAANLKNKVYFNTGETESNEMISKRLGKQTIVVQTASSSTSTNSRSNSESDQFKEVPLVSDSDLSGLNRPGHCVIVSAAYKHPVSFVEKPMPYDENSATAQLEKKCEQLWAERLLPALQEEHQTLLPIETDPLTGQQRQVTIADEISNREFVADMLLPHPNYLKAKEQAERTVAAVSKAATAQRPQTLLPTMKG